jgi:hypothetical protein
MGKRHRGEEIEGRIVPDLFALDDTAVAVGRVLAEAHVGDHQEVPALGANGADGLLDHAAVGIALGSQRILVFRQAEEDDAGDSQGLDLPRLSGGLIRREMEAAGKGGDLPAETDAGGHEKRIDQLPGADPVLADEGTEAL